MSATHETMQRVFEATGMQPTELAVALNTSPQNITNWSKRGISKPGAALVSQKLGVSATYILTGEGEKMSSATDNQPSSNSTAKKESDVGGVVDVRFWSSNDPLPEDEYDLIPFYKDVEFEGGPGRVEFEDRNGYKLAFAKSTLYKWGVKPNEIMMLSITGDSMEPVIPPGSTVGINKAEQRIIDGKIYAINHDGLLRIKRLYRLPGNKVKLVSYNTIDHPDEEDSLEKVTIIGRVFTWQVKD